MELTKGALVSFGEQATSRALRKYFRGQPYVIHKDVAVRQVINVTKEELSSAGEWDYYTKAAFDFVICNDDKDQSYELIVEYDGIQHDKPEYILKDSLKDRLCINAGLPILRIGIEDVKLRGNATLLQFILDQYFGGKAVAALQESGKLSEEEEYFSVFGETVEIQKRLLKKGLFSAFIPLHFFNEGKHDIVEHMHWYRVMDKELRPFRQPGSEREYWAAKVKVDILKGMQSEKITMSVEKQAIIRDCNPRYNILGVHGWHIALELAKYMCFKTIEEKWKERR